MCSVANHIPGYEAPSCSACRRAAHAGIKRRSTAARPSPLPPAPLPTLHTAPLNMYLDSIGNSTALPSVTLSGGVCAGGSGRSLLSNSRSLFRAPA